MKKKEKQIIGILVLAAVMIIGIIYIIATRENKMIKNNKSSIEKMTDSSRIAELEKQIDKLNAEHTSYAEYIQTNKQKLAIAITNKGVTTNANDELETMASNIAKIKETSCTILNSVTTTSKEANPSASYTISEEGNYIFLLFNSGYNGHIASNGKIQINDKDIELTKIAEHLPLYDYGVLFKTEVIYAKKGDVAIGYFSAPNPGSWKNICTIIPIQL